MEECNRIPAFRIEDHHSREHYVEVGGAVVSDTSEERREPGKPL